MSWFKSKAKTEEAVEVKEKPECATVRFYNDWITPHLVSLELNLDGEQLPTFWVKKADWEAYGLKPLLPSIRERIEVYFPAGTGERAYQSLEQLASKRIDYKEANIVLYPPNAGQQAMLATLKAIEDNKVRQDKVVF